MIWLEKWPIAVGKYDEVNKAWDELKEKEFVDKIRTEHKLKGGAIHTSVDNRDELEQTHHFFDSVYVGDKSNVGNACLTWLETNETDVLKKVTDKYEKEDWDTESCAYVISEIIKDHGLGAFLESTFVGNEVIANFANELKNYWKYGKDWQKEGARDRFQLGFCGTGLGRHMQCELWEYGNMD